jgi:hypothetical protein
MPERIKYALMASLSSKKSINRRCPASSSAPSSLNTVKVGAMAPCINFGTSIGILPKKFGVGLILNTHFFDYDAINTPWNKTCRFEQILCESTGLCPTHVLHGFYFPMRVLPEPQR